MLLDYHIFLLPYRVFGFHFAFFFHLLFIRYTCFFQAEISACQPPPWETCLQDSLKCLGRKR